MSIDDMHFGHIFVSLLVKCNYFYSNVGLIDYLLGIMVISCYFRLGPFCTVDTVNWEFFIRKIYEMFYFHLSHMLCAVQDCCIAFSHLASCAYFWRGLQNARESEPNRAISEDRTLPVFWGLLTQTVNAHIAVHLLKISKLLPMRGTDQVSL